MLSKDIPHILKELYEIQPSLREREDEVIKVIHMMKENSPKLVIDNDFRLSLRKKLLDEAGMLQPKKKKFFPDWRTYYPIYVTAFASFFIVIVFWGIFGKSIDTHQKWSDAEYIGGVPPSVPELFRIAPDKYTNGIEGINTTQSAISLRENNLFLDTPKTSVSMEQVSMKRDYIPTEITQSGLTDEARRLFRARLDTIPLEKRVSSLKHLESQIQRQIDTANIKGNNKLVAKLHDILDIIHEEQGNMEDTSLINGVNLGNE